MSEVTEYKCPRCGGALSFDTALQKMKCQFCDTDFDVEAIREAENSFGNDDMNWQGEAEEWNDSHMRVYVCTSCGGEIIADEVVSATECPFCQNPVILKGNLSGELKPDLIIPFKLDKKMAVEKFRQHLSDKKLLPKFFRSENKIEEIKGIYVPFWTYNTGANAFICYKGEKVSHSSDINYDYTERSYFSAVREGRIEFENIPVDASQKISDDLMESIEPFDFSEALPFHGEYLSGFFADKYDVTKEECSCRANERIKVTTENAFRSTVQGYSSVETLDSRIVLSGGKIRYALLPVWILNVIWNDKKYIFAMNGQTGKFVGDLPLDKKEYIKRFIIAALGGAAASGILITLFEIFM